MTCVPPQGCQGLTGLRDGPSGMLLDDVLVNLIPPAACLVLTWPLENFRAFDVRWSEQKGPRERHRFRDDVKSFLGEVADGSLASGDEWGTEVWERAGSRWPARRGLSASPGMDLHAQADSVTGRGCGWAGPRVDIPVRQGTASAFHRGALSDRHYSSQLLSLEVLDQGDDPSGSW